MSSFRNVKITCPDCNAEGTYMVWDSVNVDLNPELKPKVMDGSLFTWVCPSCKKSFNAPYSFLYHDMTRNLLIKFNASRSHITPFAEYLKILENDLDMKAIYAIAEKYREHHPKMNILFDGMSNEKELVFTVLEMPNRFWEKTEQKYSIPYDEYLDVLEKMK